MGGRGARVHSVFRRAGWRSCCVGAGHTCCKTATHTSSAFPIGGSLLPLHPENGHYLLFHYLERRFLPHSDLGLPQAPYYLPSCLACLLFGRRLGALYMPTGSPGLRPSLCKQYISALYLSLTSDSRSTVSPTPSEICLLFLLILPFSRTDRASLPFSPGAVGTALCLSLPCLYTP